ncbi:hypothetical protein ACRN96_22260 [Shewanella oncorhynchi]|uniref:hypothetical protein n=1 Tax=Shewanella oncorhynchi TaxID=2726434 RepID=UPI003D78EE52
MNVWVGKHWKHKAVYHAYMDLVGRCFDSFNLISTENIKGINGTYNLIKKIIFCKEKQILTPFPLSTIIFSFLGFKTLIWFQGAGSHESYLRHKSFFRFIILSFFEAYSLKRAHKIIFVSDFMKEFYEKTYPWVVGKSVVHYCKSDFRYNGTQKIANSYCYIGGASSWQKVDDMLSLFKMILKRNPAAKMYIATRDFSDFESKIIRLSLESNIELCTLNGRDEINEFLSKMQFGFLLRDDIVVNNIASPIKLAEYLSCDVNVITTNALKSFYSDIISYKAGVVIDLDKLDNFNFESFSYNKNNSERLYLEKFEGQS